MALLQMYLIASEFIDGRSKPSSRTNLENTQKQTHPTKHQKHPLPQLSPPFQFEPESSQIDAQGRNLPPQMHPLGHAADVGRPQGFRTVAGKRRFRSGGVEIEVDDLMLMAAAVTVSALSVLRRVIAIVIIGVVIAAAVVILDVVPLERVRSAGHWTGESRAVDTLRQTAAAASAIGGRVVVVVVAVMLVAHFLARSSHQHRGIKKVWA